jgi:hypothetical protein
MVRARIKWIVAVNCCYHLVVALSVGLLAPLKVHYDFAMAEEAMNRPLQRRGVPQEETALVAVL